MAPGQQTSFGNASQFLIFRGERLSRATRSLGKNDGLQLVHCSFQDRVDENIAVFLVIHNLLLGVLKSSLYYFRVHLFGLASAAQATLENLFVDRKSTRLNSSHLG